MSYTLSPGAPVVEQRITKGRPCDACRRRKSRCVLNRIAEKCVLCNFHNQDCTFTEAIPSRKRKSVSLEDEGGSKKKIVEPLRTTPSDRHVSLDNPELPVEDYAQLKGPSLLKKTLGLQRRHHGLFIGSSGRFEPALMVADSAFGPKALVHEISFRHVNDNDIFMLACDQATKLFDAEQDDLDAIERLIAPHGKALIHLYFRIVHPSFPILHKDVFLEKYERTYREFSPVLLAAVYILAIEFWSYSSELTGHAAPDIDALEIIASRSMSYAIHRSKLSTVEAGLLLLQRSSESSWPLTAQMVAVSQDLGLHRDCSNWNIPEWEKGLRKRLSWAVIMQDKWAALVHGRPSHIYRSDWNVGPLSDQDFPETFADENDEEGSTEVETGRAIFMYMVSLTQILSDILTSCYSGAAEADVIEDQAQATALVLTRAKPLQIRLKEWYASLPQCLSMENVKARKLSSTGSLHLAYWAAELSLHRCIIRTLSDCTDPNIIRICQHAALIRSASAMDVVKALRPEHWSSFWYFASEFNFGLIGLFRVLLATSLATADDITVSMENLDQYTWTLKMSQKNVRFLHKSIAMIDHGVRNLRLRFLNKELDERNARRQVLSNRSTYISESPSYSTENSHETLASLGSLDPNIAANDISQNPEDSSFFFDTSPMSEDCLRSYSQQVDGTHTSYI